MKLKLIEEKGANSVKDDLIHYLRQHFGSIHMYDYNENGIVQDASGNELYRGFTILYDFEKKTDVDNNTEITNIAITNVGNKNSNYVAFTFEEIRKNS